MKSWWLFLLFSVALAGCSSLFAPSPPAEVARKRSELEALVKRHGFTCAGHPESEPVMAIGMFDEVLGGEAVLETRRCDLKPYAYSYKADNDGGYSFVFKQDREPHLAHMAGIDSEGNFWVNESYCDLHQVGFIRLPPNTSFERTRGR